MGLDQGEELPDGGHDLELCLARGKVDKVSTVDLHRISTCISGKNLHAKHLHGSVKTQRDDSGSFIASLITRLVLWVQDYVSIVTIMQPS